VRLMITSSRRYQPSPLPSNLAADWCNAGPHSLPGSPVARAPESAIRAARFTRSHRGHYLAPRGQPDYSISRGLLPAHTAGAVVPGGYCGMVFTESTSGPSRKLSGARNHSRTSEKASRQAAYEAAAGCEPAPPGSNSEHGTHTCVRHANPRVARNRRGRSA
jgi:hypothetical protein